MEGNLNKCFQARGNSDDSTYEIISNHTNNSEHGNAQYNHKVRKHPMSRRPPQASGKDELMQLL